MLIEQTTETLHTLRLHGMAKALLLQRQNPTMADLSFEERVGLLVDAERAARDNRRLQRLLKTARLKVSGAVIEDVDYRAARGLDKRKFAALAQGDWVTQHQHVIFTGPTGIGKTYLACALGQLAARQGIATLYRRTGRLLEEIDISRADGSLGKLRLSLAKVQVLILDDWGLSPLTAQQRQDLLELVDDCIGQTSLVITSQLPVDCWHDFVGEATVADAILDRIVHGAHHFELKGASMRRRAGPSE